MPVLRRIWGEVDDSTYFAFVKRARDELTDIPEKDRVSAAFSGMVKAYARGLELCMPKRAKEHAKPTGAKYGKE